MKNWNAPPARVPPSICPGPNSALIMKFHIINTCNYKGTVVHCLVTFRIQLMNFLIVSSCVYCYIVSIYLKLVIDHSVMQMLKQINILREKLRDAEHFYQYFCWNMSCMLNNLGWVSNFSYSISSNNHNYGLFGKMKNNWVESEMICRLLSMNVTKIFFFLPLYY